MNNLQEAVNWLRDKGYQASIRLWSPGETVMAYNTVREEHGQRVMDGLCYIYRDQTDWVLLGVNDNELGDGYAESHFPSLDDAVEKAEFRFKQLAKKVLSRK